MFEKKPDKRGNSLPSFTAWAPLARRRREKLLDTNNIGALPVRDEDGKMVGIISSRDVMGALIEEMRLERGVLRDMAIIKS